MAPKLTKPLANYSHTRVAGTLVFVAGQGCRDPKTDAYPGLELDAQGKIAAYDVALQTKGVLKNIELALQDIDLSLNDVVDITVFLKDKRDFPAMNDVWNDCFKSENRPTRTTVIVKDLPGSNFVEMKAVAAKPHS